MELQSRQGAQLLRPPISRVLPVTQVTARLSGSDPTKAFVDARQESLRWIKRRYGNLPESVWQGGDYESDDVETNPLNIVTLEDPLRYWAARLVFSDKEVARRDWVTEIGIINDGEKSLVGVRLTCVSSKEDSPVGISVPGLVHQLSDSPGLEDYGWQLKAEPWVISNEDDVEQLAELIQLPGRSRPIFVVSLLSSGTHPVDYPTLAKSCRGIAHVVALPSHLSSRLDNIIGREFSVFNGAVRTYFPNLDIFEDHPTKHPFAPIARLRQWHDAGFDGFERYLVGVAARYSVRPDRLERVLPSFAAIKRLALEQRQKAANKRHDAQEQLQLASQQIAELQKDRDGWYSLAVGEENARRQAEEQLKETIAESQSLRTQIWSLRKKLESQTGHKIDEEIPIPDSLSEAQDWAEEHLAGRLLIHNRAARACKKSSFEDVSLAFRALLLLANEYREMRMGGGKEKFESKLNDLGLDEDRSFAGGGAHEEGDNYFVTYLGEKRYLERHIKGRNIKDDRYCLRIYFFWDEETEKVVVGWMPSHLPNRAT